MARVAGTGSCSYFNPFGSAYVNPAKANSPGLVRSLIGYSGLRGKALLVTFDGLVSGDVADFADGTIQSALGAQYRRSTFRHDWGDYINAGELITLGQAPDFSGAQEVASVFGEAKVPLTELADLTLSGRYEKYANSFSRSMPRDRVEYGLNWSLGASALNVRGHYVSPYTNDRTGITNARIGAWNSFDLQYSHTFSGLAGGTTLSLGVVNVFDKSPPVAQLNLGFGPIVHDPRGRVFTVALNQKF